MRWMTLLLLAALGACNLLTTTGGSGAGAGTTGSGGAGGGGVCQTAATCADCKSCALAGACATMFNACEADADCNAIDQCYQANCGGIGAACLASCYANNPNGQSAYAALNSCVYCTECSKGCPGQCS